MNEDGGEKTHEATPRRLEDARREGQVPRSQDLPAALVLLAAVILLMRLGPWVVDIFADFANYSLREPFLLIVENTENGGLFNSMIGHLYGMTLRFLGPMTIFFGVLLLVAIGANIGQVGFLWLPQKLAINPSHLDPIKGFGRIFSMQSVMRLVMGIVKIIICAAVAYYAIRNEITTILSLTGDEEPQIAAYLVYILLQVALKVAIALVILAILDYMYQRWKSSQDLRMTTEELKREMKEMAGDPQIVMKRRQIQRELAQGQRSAQGASDATVVVTNPTHLAVAIKFDWDRKDIPPIVVAKGAEYWCQEIRRIALKHGIPIIENKPLARSLFKTVGVGQSIPQEHWEAVAKILAYVSELKGHKVPAAYEPK